jgi:hypothetical protein
LLGGNLDIDGLGVKLGSDEGSEADFEDGGRDGTKDDSSLGFKEQNTSLGSSYGALGIDELGSKPGLDERS